MVGGGLKFNLKVFRNGKQTFQAVVLNSRKAF